MATEMTLCPKRGQTISASTTSARTGTAFTAPEIRIKCASDLYIKLGDSTVVATTEKYDMVYFAADGPLDIKNQGHSHLAVIMSSGSDTVYVNEWEK